MFRLFGPEGLGLFLGNAQVDMLIHAIDPADRDHVVLEAACEIELGQFDLVTEDVVDATDVTAVRTDDFQMFLDQRGVYPGVSPFDVAMPVTTRPERRGFNETQLGLLIFPASQEEHLAELINLNRARKARAKDEAKVAAAVNRTAHGRTRGQREAAEAERDKASRLLDGAKREPNDD